MRWIAFGPASYLGSWQNVANHTSKVKTLGHLLRKLYDMEFADVHVSDKSVSVEGKAAIEITRGVMHIENGHFIFPVPWKGIQT